MDRKEKALLKFREGHSCSQVVFSAFSDQTNFDEKSAEIIASGFGGGLAHTHSVCGAITGGVMAIGLLNQQYSPNNAELKQKSYLHTQQFIDSFKNKNSYSDCAPLLEKRLKNSDPVVLKYDINDPCEKYVVDAIAIIEKLFKVETIK